MITRESLKNEIGATMTEYALLAALLIVVVIGAVTTVGLETRENFHVDIVEDAFIKSRR